MKSHDDPEVIPAPAKRVDRWCWTRRLSRLGVVGATVLGTGVAFELGGYNGVLAAWLYGLPFSLPLAWHDAFSPALHGSPAAAWGGIHLVLGAATIASWTSIGIAVDLIRHRMRGARGGSGSASLLHGQDDGYLQAAQLEVERILGDKLREPRGNEGDQPKRLLSSIARLVGAIGARVRASSDMSAVQPR